MTELSVRERVLAANQSAAEVLRAADGSGLLPSVVHYRADGVVELVRDQFELAQATRGRVVEDVVANIDVTGVSTKVGLTDTEKLTTNIDLAGATGASTKVGLTDSVNAAYHIKARHLTNLRLGSVVYGPIGLFFGADRAQVVLVEGQREVVADVRALELHHELVAEDVPVAELVRLRQAGLPPRIEDRVAVGRCEWVRGVVIDHPGQM